jgi:hypothetical protein
VSAASRWFCGGGAGWGAVLAGRAQARRILGRYEGARPGLGLEIVHRIVTQKFGGKIDVESKPGDTRFIVRLPRKSAADASATPPQNGRP